MNYDADRVGKMSDQEVVAHLTTIMTQRIQQYYPELDPLSSRITGFAWGGQETARTFRFELTADGLTEKRILYVKLCPIFERLNPSAMEYETLQLLYRRMPSLQPNCHVSRPLDFYPELNAYAMESVGTKDFRSLLLKSNSRWKSDASLAALYASVKGSGDWLRTFHAITAADKQVLFDSRVFLEGVNEDCHFQTVKEFSFQRETLVALDSLMARLDSLNKRYSMPCAKWHWDFTPGHVYLDGGNISVIDILGLPETPIYEDIGRFLASMAAINTFPMHPLFDHMRADTVLCDIFLDAYARELSEDRELFLLFANIHKIKYLIIWFSQQHYRVSSKLHPAIGKFFANTRLVGLYEPILLRNIRAASVLIDRLA